MMWNAAAAALSITGSLCGLAASEGRTRGDSGFKKVNIPIVKEPKVTIKDTSFM